MVITLPIEMLRINDRNARIHSGKHKKQIARSIEEFRYFNPIVVDEKDTIIAGHGRYEAAKLLKLTEVPVIERWQRLTGGTARHADNGQPFVRSGLPAAGIEG